MAQDDSKRVRDKLSDMACETVDIICGNAVQHWFPFDERVPPTGGHPGLFVYFDNVAQNAMTLSGGGATVEEGVLVADLIVSQTQLSCGSVTTGEMYRVATRIAASFTVGTTVHLAAVSKGSATQWLGQRIRENPAKFEFTPDERMSGTLPNVTPYGTASKITITQQPIVGPPFMMRRTSECHLPVQIGYRAVTNGPERGA